MVPNDRVPFRTRLFVYVGVWLLAALVSVLVPDNEFTFAEQLKSVPLVPLVVAFGLSLVITFPAQPTAMVVAFAAAFVVAHGIATLIQTRQNLFRVLIAVHFAIILVATVYLVRVSDLPSGG